MVGERNQQLRRLVVRGGAPEIAALGQLRHLPAPGQVRHLRRVYIHTPFESERRADALQMQARPCGVGAHGNLGLPVIHLHLPVKGSLAAQPFCRVQNDHGGLGTAGVKTEDEYGAKEREILQ